MTCNVCSGNKRIRVPTYNGLDVIESGDALPRPGLWEEFDCPKCVPMVPYRRVRATKVTTAYDAEYYGKFQMPIERSLAARFGEFLLREGLIKFTTTGSKDFGRMEDKIIVTAHLGVVSPDDVKRAGAVAEVATTAAPTLPERVRRRAKLPAGSATWSPKPAPWSPDPEITDEFDEPKDALGARFSGLEID